MSRKPITTISLDSPFAAPRWPDVALDDQNHILDELTRLLSPIGQYRQSQPISKGKRSRKRQKSAPNIAVKPDTENEAPKAAPEISSSITIGFNDTNRLLEAIARSPVSKTQSELTIAQISDAKTAASISNSTKRKATNSTSEAINTTQRLAAVFVCKSALPNSLYTHLPLLIAIASRATPDRGPIRLVALNKPADVRLAEMLGLPRVGFLGLMEDAPDATELVNFVREKVESVNVPLLEEAPRASYLPLQVQITETSAPMVQKKPKTDAKPGKVTVKGKKAA